LPHEAAPAETQSLGQPLQFSPASQTPSLSHATPVFVGVRLAVAVETAVKVGVKVAVCVGAVVCVLVGVDVAVCIGTAVRVLVGDAVGVGAPPLTTVK
jgi:hypothetical protein